VSQAGGRTEYKVRQVRGASWPDREFEEGAGDGQRVV